MKYAKKVEFIRIIFHSYGQVFFQHCMPSGIIIFCALLICSPLLAAASTISTLAALGTAFLLKAERENIYNGVYTFNATIIGLTVAVYFPLNLKIWILIFFAGIFSTIITHMLRRLFKKINLSPLTAPFVLTGWIVFLTKPAPIVYTGANQTLFNYAVYIEGTLHGLGEIIFQGNLLAGTAGFLALLISSRLAAFWAVVGAFSGVLVADFFMANAETARLGIYSYSPALAGIAIGSGIFLKVSWKNHCATLLAVLLCSMLQIKAVSAFSIIGIPPLTAAFICVSWIFLLIIPRCKFIQN